MIAWSPDRQARAFLSTLSLRRATDVACGDRHKLYDFYPRSPCGERRPWKGSSLSSSMISIHALLAESDLVPHQQKCGDGISIHALLAESDAPHKNDRGPGGKFLSTLSLRRATAKKGIWPNRNKISIHALLAESDPSAILGIPNQVDFYPRSPCGERRMSAGSRDTGL